MARGFAVRYRQRAKPQLWGAESQRQDLGAQPGLIDQPGTGFTSHAGTGWLVVRGPAAPNEGSFQLTFFISDLGDSVLATGVLLDNFRWECSGCFPSAPGSCGLQPQ